MQKKSRLWVGRVAHSDGEPGVFSHRLSSKNARSILVNAGTLLSCLSLLLAGGCQKSSTNDEAGKDASSQPSSSTLPTSRSRIRWLGKKRIAAETNAAGLMQIWNLPTSIAFESQVIDKLALALAQTNLVPYTNHAIITDYATQLKGTSAILRPLLNDVLMEESLSEFVSDEALQLVFAIKLDQTQHRFWHSNLLAAMRTWDGAKLLSQDANGWQMQLSNLPLWATHLTRPAVKSTKSEGVKSSTLTAEIRRAGDWTLVSLGQKDSALLRDFRSRIEKDRAPFPQRETNFWFEVENLDSSRFPDFVGSNPSSKLPGVSLTVIGDGTNILTRGKLSFSEPLSLDLAPWIIPTNLVSAPLVSFTAMRGFGKVLGSSKVWEDMQAGAAPNQLFIWAAQAVPAQTYFAAPHSDASNTVSKITEYILRKGSPFITTNQLVKFERSETSGGLIWRGLPVIDPFLKASVTNNSQFILAGLFQHDIGLPAPAELLRQLTDGATNLVYYDWELTGPRIEHWDYLGQFFRYGLDRKQMNGKMPSRAFIDSAASKLGNCGTVLALTDPKTLSFSRRSSLGFTAVELHALADWFESPNFPYGLHSFIKARPIALPSAAPAPGQNSTNQ